MVMLQQGDDRREAWTGLSVQTYVPQSTGLQRGCLRHWACQLVTGLSREADNS